MRSNWLEIMQIQLQLRWQAIKDVNVTLGQNQRSFTSEMASVIPPAASPRRFLLALKLFHLSSPSSLSFLQLGDPFRLLWACLARDGLPSSICDQFVQPPKGRVYILRLLARVVGLDDKLRRLGSVVARGQDVWAQQWREERQDGGGGDADGSFGGDSGRVGSDQLSNLQRQAMTPRDERRMAWQRTCSHSDRLARSSD